MKIKTPPCGLVIHTPTEADVTDTLNILKENGWDPDSVPSKAKGIQIKFHPYLGWWINIEAAKKAGRTVLTLSEFKEKYCKNDAPETKLLNLCELLKGHEGETFYSPCYGKMTLSKTDCDALETARGGLTVKFNLDGRLWVAGSSEMPMLYPSRALYEQYPLDPYTAWMEWQKEQKKPFISIHWGEVDYDGNEEEDYTGNTYFRTPSDRDKVLEELKAILKKYAE